MDVKKVRKDLIARGMKESDFEEYGHGLYVVVNDISKRYFADVGMKGVIIIPSIDGSDSDVYDVQAD